MLTRFNVVYVNTKNVRVFSKISEILVFKGLCPSERTIRTFTEPNQYRYLRAKNYRNDTDTTTSSIGKYREVSKSIGKFRKYR